MATLNPILKRVLLVLLCVFVAQGAAAYKPASKAKKDTLKANKDAATSNATVERDFDTIRGFQSYDPATDKWSKIEDFDTVDILEDTTSQREGHYIYHSFWAYDAVKRRWYKADICDYGYKLGKLAATLTKKGASAKEQPKKIFRFWRNWSLGLRAGGGATFYENRIGHFSITEIDGEFYLQTATQTEDAYKPNWFGAITKCRPDSLKKLQGTLGINRVGNDKHIVFKGQGWNIPITLFTHYTFFKRVRLGAGFEFEINHLKELKSKEGTSNLMVFNVQPHHAWFYNTAWFGSLGFKVLHTPYQDIIVELQVGQNFNLGSDLHILSERENYIYNGWLCGGGVAYERKLNNYFRFLTRIGGEWKVHDDTPEGLSDADASITLHQVAIHLDLGIQLSFGKDTEEKENAEECEQDHDAASAKDSAED